MSGPVVPPELREHAADLWRYLDQLADSDPDAYKQFIAQQLQQRKSTSSQPPPRPPALFLPSPVFTLQTQQTRPTSRPVYVNFCQSTQVQPILLQNQQPANDDDIRIMSGLLIPLSVGKPRHTTSSTTEPLSDGDRRDAFDYECLRALAATQAATSLPAVSGSSVRCDVYDVVFHPSTLQHASHSLPLMLAVIQLAWQHIQQDDPPCTLHEQYRPVPGVRYVGDRAPQQTEKQQQSTKHTLAPQPKPIVLPSRTALAEQKEQEEQAASTDTLTELKTTTAATVPSAKAGKVLIEEVDEPRQRPVWEERYEAGRLCMSVQLPGVDSMSELNVEMSGRQVVVSGGVYELNVRLQREVLDDTCTVKWSRKKHLLSIAAAVKQ